MADANQSQAKPIKIIAGADDFGCSLKDSVLSYLSSHGIPFEDLGTNKYYSVAQEIGRRVSDSRGSDEPFETRGLLACGTGGGVAMFANKFPGVYATNCTSVDDALNTRSINDCNVLALGGMKTSPEEAYQILEAWLKTPFKSPCPASENSPWPPEIESFLDKAVNEMAMIPERKEESSSCAICCLSKNMEFVPVGIMPGGSMKILRQSPTSAIVRFKAGSVEPAHHHTFGHDLVVLKGSKTVWNLTNNESYDLGPGDYLYTPAPDVHRVKYFEDTEFFIRWDGGWDIFLDEDLGAAKAEIAKGCSVSIEKVTN
ncbi:hypothetical protein AMTRI_Chr08g167170 [Amborella trichopoda]|uniref:ChrR-like cupin domain-containing protein n=1 Tax=Amborella trichopoda TaxID=13333 RepID=W1PCB8_AMBTC|nr:DNA damage-repair/toleration protein DRT102 [Amborella trichopoda]ERN05349.1 hypothetical protein AMTR_s00007p00190260 [Amborella trichopoda]|eukprot:XP_006843674.1 DNA damage-repair/toleration protein DRT102 [Amborella trichopoda]